MIKRDSLLANFFLVFTVGAIIVFFINSTLQMHFDYPFADQVDSYRIAFDFLRNNLTLQTFLEPHNEHRPYVSRLITIYSVVLGGGTSSAELIVLIGVFISIYITACSLLPSLLNVRLKMICFFFFALLIFNPAGAINWYWPYMLEMPLALFFVLLAFSKAAKGAVILPGFFFICALCSQAIGLFGSLALSLSFFMAYLMCRRYLRFAILWLIFFLFTFIIYVRGIPQAGHDFNIINTLQYTLIFLGKIPYSLFHFPNHSMWGYPGYSYFKLMFGALFFGLYLYMLYIEFYSEFSMRRVSYHSCVIFVFIAALLLSISRGSISSEGPSHANSQPTYLLASFFYIGLILIAWELRGISIIKYFVYFAVMLLPFSFVTRFEFLNVMNEVVQFKQALQLEYTSPIKNEEATIVFPNAEIGVKFIKEYCVTFRRCDI